MKKDYLAELQTLSRQRIPRFDFHLHTQWTDGEAGVSEMHCRAEAVGLNTILFSEHARKTSADWFKNFEKEVRSLSGKKCQALVGVETKVEDFQGNLDCAEAILKRCDLVMASVHRFPGEKGIVRQFDEVLRTEAVELEFKLACAILKNPKVDILAHPFGMCFRRFGIFPPKEKIRALIEETAKTRIAFEINCHYHPEPWLLIDWCQEMGARVSLGSNAHRLDEVGKIVRVLEGKEVPWIQSVS
jgi:putative hydrolase